MDYDPQEEASLPVEHLFMPGDNAQTDDVCQYTASVLIGPAGQRGAWKCRVGRDYHASPEGVVGCLQDQVAELRVHVRRTEQYFRAALFDYISLLESPDSQHLDLVARIRQTLKDAPR